jgi:riboflavin biosynthesis pyrimidine reductase
MPNESEQYLARQRVAMEVVTAELVNRVGWEAAARTLLAQAVTVLEAEGGPSLAARYLRELADDVERTGPQEGAGRN